MTFSKAIDAAELIQLSAVMDQLGPLLGMDRLVTKASFTRVSVGPSAKVYKVERGTSLPPLAVKVCLDPETGETSGIAAGDYFRSMERMSAFAAYDPVLASAKPLLLSQNLGTVVLEWIDGPTLDAVIRRGGPGSRDEFRRLGAWLAHLQNLSGVEYRPLDCGHLLDIIGDLHHGKRPSKPVRDAVELLRESRNKIEETPIPWAISCGDFKPANVVAAGGRLVALDLDFRHQRPAIHDIAHLLNHADLKLSIPRFGRPSSQTPAMAFLEGYLEDALVELPALQLAWLRLQHAVRLVALHAMWAKPPKAWLTATFVFHLLKKRKLELQSLLCSRAGIGADIAVSEKIAVPTAQILEHRVRDLENALIFIVEDEDTWLSKASFGAVESVLKNAPLKPWQFLISD